MRAISSFSREAGMSTFWCRAWSALRTRVSMSATGSVNLIALLLLEPPVRSARFQPIAENLRRLYASIPTAVVVPGGHPERRCLPRRISLGTTAWLPGRLRNPWNLAAQRQLPETQPADAELAQKCPRTSAQVAAVVFAGRELGFLGRVLMQAHVILHSFCCCRQTSS